MNPRPIRRRLLAAALAGPALLLSPRVHAGAQQYEPLAVAVRNALAAQIADTRPPVRSFDRPDERVAFIHWLGEMSTRLQPRKPDYQTRVEFLRTLDYECARAGLDRQMVLGLIQVESGFRKYAISSAGARGYMQVMPFWTRVIGDGDPRRLFDMRSNLRYGCVIMRHYLDIEKGDLFLALGRYNGSRGRAEYPNAVHAAWKNRWSYDPARAPRA
ncbi:MAG: lytic transglycosylase domain-containing protein [Burkholderiaceae bacterium]|jgi:soluble lytic murein transglycosylase-like protein|nr:lytic transglycosylase domain-containing protein [Burkholderiaceae bacterium]